MTPPTRQQLEAALLDRAIANNLAESEQKKAEQLSQRVGEHDVIKTRLEIRIQELVSDNTILTAKLADAQARIKELEKK